MNNKDIYSYLNSRDTREYLEKVDYQFSSLEAMWIIWRCKRLNVRQRHEAWRKFIESFPDCPIKRRGNVDANDSLHGYLREVMEAENQVINAVSAEDADAIYLYKLWDDNGFLSKRIYKSYEECLSAATEEYDPKEDAECYPIVIEKRWLDETNDVAYVIVDTNIEVLDLGVVGKSTRFGLYERHEYDFDGFWFHIPTPFKKGDFVISTIGDVPGPSKGIFNGQPEPFVLSDTSYERACSYPQERLQSKLEYSDSSDMTAYGYWLRPDGSFYWECMHNYLDLEYYREEPKGLLRVLHALSLEMRGKIDPDLYADAVRLFISEDVAGDAAMRMKLYSQEALDELGLERGKIEEMWGPYYGLPGNIVLI